MVNYSQERFRSEEIVNLKSNNRANIFEPTMHQRSKVNRAITR